MLLRAFDLYYFIPQGRQKTKLDELIFSHTFRSIWTKFDAVFKQSRLSFLILRVRVMSSRKIIVVLITVSKS